MISMEDNCSFDIRLLSKELKLLVSAFLICIAIGYSVSLFLVDNTTSLSGEGVKENFLGNEDDVDAELMKFKKSTYEMYNIIHTHIISISMLFLIIAFIVSACDLPRGLKMFLMLEPFVSILLTFGGMYIVWSGIEIFSYVVLLSGVLMTTCLYLSCFFALKQMWTQAHKDFNS